MSNRDAWLADDERWFEAYEHDEFESVLTADSRAAYERAAALSLRKDKRVNIRMSGRDIELLQARALREGIPYQTLMSSVLHKYVSGRLEERDS